MIKWILSKIVGSRNQRMLKKLWPIVKEINEYDKKFQNLSGNINEMLVDKTKNWQRELKEIESKILSDINKTKDEKISVLLEKLNIISERSDKSDDELNEVREIQFEIQKAKDEFRIAKTELLEKVSEEQAKYLNKILPEAFAVVKNGARQLFGKKIMVCDQELTWEMIHFDVQLLGGIVLHKGMITEMATGEGKTLVATLPTYLNALTGRGVHIVTVNDYLAKRDSEWMGTLFTYLGLTVGCIQNDQDPDYRKEQYEADITYGTNSEFGFDYLRDNGMATSVENQVQRDHYYCIIDEVDSVLIDEARTPLIISGPVEVSTHQYDKYKHHIRKLFKEQNKECNSLIQEAKKIHEGGNISHDLGRLLLKVKIGQPKNRALLRFMEDPELRKLIDKTELSLYKEPQKTELFALKEELYFTIDEKSHEADLTDKGRSYLDPENPESFILPDLTSEYSKIDGDESLSDKQKNEKKLEIDSKLDIQAERMHNISQLLKAYCLFEKDKEYVVKDGKVIIVDEHTGREMPGRRWSDGLHQAVEAKEGVSIDKESQTLATITIQNYFRLYEKLAGMTGTAETEAAEFHDIYNMEIAVIPTNKPNQRKDINDKIFKTRREKYKAAINYIKECHSKNQPILVGTASVEASETLSRMLKREKIVHSVLNAKYHRQEAEIISKAGRLGAVTVSTNMAGRGTDIKLGEGVNDLGGLAVIGTERHESRRIDRQLRGRCARQGDNGASMFYVSFEDDLMRNFGASDKMTKIMERFGLQEGEELSHPWLNKSVESAQKRIEQMHYRSRKYVLEFDDVMNQQRNVIYGLREEIIHTDNPRFMLEEIIDEIIPVKLEEYIDPEDSNKILIPNLLSWAQNTFPFNLQDSIEKIDKMNFDEISKFLIDEIKKTYKIKAKNVSLENLIEQERIIVLHSIDTQWKEHLYSMDALRDGVNLRSYGQKDPLVEYKKEAFSIFENLINTIKVEVLNNLFKSLSNLQKFERAISSLPYNLRKDINFSIPGIDSDSSVKKETMNQAYQEQSANNSEDEFNIKVPIKRETPKVGRNSPCPCGSGKKYKKCHGK